MAPSVSRRLVVQRSANSTAVKPLERMVPLVAADASVVGSPNTASLPRHHGLGPDFSAVVEHFRTVVDADVAVILVGDCQSSNQSIRFDRILVNGESTRFQRKELLDLNGRFVTSFLIYT